MQAVRLTGCQAPAAARHHVPQRQRHGRVAAPLPLVPRRHANLLTPCRAMSDDDDEDWEAEEQQQQAAPAPAPVQQAAAEEAAAAASATAEAASAASVRRSSRQAKRGVAAAPAVAEPDMGQAWKMGLGGVAALAAVAGLGFLGHRLSKSKAMTDAVSNVQQVGGCWTASKGWEQRGMDRDTARSLLAVECCSHSASWDGQSVVGVRHCCVWAQATRRLCACRACVLRLECDANFARLAEDKRASAAARCRPLSCQPPLPCHASEHSEGAAGQGVAAAAERVHEHATQHAGAPMGAPYASAGWVGRCPRHWGD